MEKLYTRISTSSFLALSLFLQLIVAQDHCEVAPAASLLQAAGFSPGCVADALVQCQSGSLHHELKEAVSVLNQHFQKPRPKSCYDIRTMTMLQDETDAVGGSGFQMIYPYHCCPDYGVPVYCDQTTEGGGWTIIHRRNNGTTREDFYRSWTEYKLGFGNLESEFWLGNDLIHEMTTYDLQELMIVLDDFEGMQKVARYSFFYIGDEKQKYKLKLGRYSGTALDAFKEHNSQYFSTYESDNDIDTRNCAKLFKGGWWYGACHSANLNGLPHPGPHASYADGINWAPWKGYHYSLAKATMMIRNVAFSH